MASTQKKVLMLTSVASMIDQFNMPNIRLLQEMGYEVHVACNFKEGNTCDEDRISALVKTLQGHGAILHPWDCSRSIYAVAKCIRAYQKLGKLMERYQFAWIHCQSPIGGALARLAAHKQGTKVIYTAHGFHFYKGAPVRNWLLYYPVEKLLAPMTDILITVNREDYCFAKRRLRAGKIYGIPGIGIDSRRFWKKQAGGAQERMAVRKKIREKFHIPQDAALLLSVGELSRRKNHQLVLSALAQLGRQDVYYLICGQGPKKEALMHRAGRLGVAGRVRMPGYQEDVAAIYLASDIFVFPSRQEGMPVALMEAMAAGLPCVVSDIRGNRELIGDTRFQLSHVGQLRHMLEVLLGQPQLWDRLGRRNQQKVAAYSQQVVQRKMKHIYQECAGLGEEKKACQKYL